MAQIELQLIVLSLLSNCTGKCLNVQYNIITTGKATQKYFFIVSVVEEKDI